MNMEKTVVDCAMKIKHLGFRFTERKDGFKPQMNEKSKVKTRKKVDYLT